MVRGRGLFHHAFNEINSNEVCADFNFASSTVASEKTFDFNATEQAAGSSTRLRKSTDRSPNMSQIKLPDIPPAKWEEVYIEFEIIH